MWKPLPNRRVLKTLRVSPKGKAGWAVINGIRVVSEGDVPVRRLSLKGGGQETGCRKDGSRRGWIKGSHIDWRRERVPVVTLGIEGGGL